MTGSDLLREIESGALDSSTDIADLLRRCVALGGASGSTQLREWATRELKGYPDPQDVPEYRVVPAGIFVDGINPRMHYKHQRISRSIIPEVARDAVPEEVRITDSIAEVAATARNAKERGKGVRLGGSVFPDIAAMISQEHWPDQITELYYDVPAATFEGIVDAVRTVVVELTAEIRAGLPAGTAEPSPELADRAVAIAVHGDHARIVQVTGPHAAVTATGVDASPGATVTPRASSSATEERAERRDLMWWLIGLATIVAAIAGVWALFLR